MAVCSPPGLEQPDIDVACEVNAAIEGVEEQLNRLGGSGVDRDEVVAAIREAVLRDVEAKVAARSEELMDKGRAMFRKMQEQHKEKNSRLSEAVTKCHEKMQMLEAENEQLKLAIAGLGGRFATLGAAFSGVRGGAVPDPMDVTATPEKIREGPSNDKLPDLPPFPFPAPFPAAPLSLEAALGSQLPQRMPLSLVDSLTPPPSPRAGTEASVTTFSFTLRKADGLDLGLDVSTRDDANCVPRPGLYIEGVRPGGAVEAWNRQCQGTASADRAVQSGDQLVDVNGVHGDPKRMLDECIQKQLLKLTVSRGEHASVIKPHEVACHDDVDAAEVGALRAGASVFVPMSASGLEVAEPTAC